MQRIFVGCLMGMLLIAGCVTHAPRGPTKTVRLNARDVSIGRTRGNPVLFQPDRHVLRAVYKTYVFSSEDFRSKVGDPGKAGDVTLEVEILSISERRHRPLKGESPEGGFRFVEYNCRILRVVAAPGP